MRVMMSPWVRLHSSPAGSVSLSVLATIKRRSVEFSASGNTSPSPGEASCGLIAAPLTVTSRARTSSASSFLVSGVMATAKALADEGGKTGGGSACAGAAGCGVKERGDAFGTVEGAGVFGATAGALS